ncbi:DUF2919 domain-containing protein [Vibrio sp. SM6]|uniref:DUF2919 domain-containing protein n=1 Tax=Vibrio agarilyticus TaxID=2726741 RepID=A0A7X8TR38_9VIBR|nr:DUF2919 domain-containing protein [Vibrio agarilyticus]
MRYHFDNYDENGFLKPPLWLWLGWIFLARSWVVFALASVSRESDSDILPFLFPNDEVLYFSLSLGTPSLILMWLISLRTPERLWVNRLTRLGWPVTFCSTLIQLGQTFHQVVLTHGTFHWVNGITLVALFWLALYLLNARWAKECFWLPTFHTDVKRK